MRADGKMSYKDFIFPVNPAVIRISHRRAISAEKVPYGNSVVNDLGIRHRVISGEGEFYGKDCISDFLRLKAVMDEGGGGMLYIPSQKPVYAMFETLELTGSDIEGVIGYKFVFIESFEKSISEREYITSGDGKSCLWDYSCQYGIGIDTLAALNPHIRRPDIPIESWKKVYLC
ncbi:MAG: DNA circularization N-terminal domain-containing protein [Clostridia bacterium]|nr:DNA circularization N-terminal domain-containing protein [Clostridia bacterium]